MWSQVTLYWTGALVPHGMRFGDRIPWLTAMPPTLALVHFVNSVGVVTGSGVWWVIIVSASSATFKRSNPHFNDAVWSVSIPQCAKHVHINLLDHILVLNKYLAAAHFLVCYSFWKDSNVSASPGRVGISTAILCCDCNLWIRLKTYWMTLVCIVIWYVFSRCNLTLPLTAYVPCMCSCLYEPNFQRKTETVPSSDDSVLCSLYWCSVTWSSEHCCYLYTADVSRNILLSRCQHVHGMRAASECGWLIAVKFAKTRVNANCSWCAFTAVLYCQLWLRDWIERPL